SSGSTASASTGRSTSTTSRAPGASDRDVEVVDVFTRAERLVQRDRRRGATIRLDEDHTRAAGARDRLQRLDEASPDAPPAVCLGYCDVVDVDLAALALELLEDVGDEAPDALRAVERRQGDERRLVEQRAEVAVGGDRVLVRVGLAEGLAERPQQALQDGDVSDREMSDRIRHGRVLTIRRGTRRSRRAPPRTAWC